MCDGTMSLTFTSQNWNAEQVVTVTGVDDDKDDGDQEYEIKFLSTVSTDFNYSSRKLDNIKVINIDNDIPTSSLPPTDTKKDGPKNGCLLTNIAKNISQQKLINHLNEIKDRYLININLSRKFVELYYKISPKIIK